MKTIGTHSFLPYLRQGVANTITEADGAAIKSRATIDVSLTLTGQAVEGAPPLTQPLGQKVALYGPGDIVGLDNRAIVKTEPRNWITNFEANYLPAIDFYDADLPWRYTPAKANGLRLRPWIALVVLAATEFEEGKGGNGPLPFIDVKDASVFPPAADLWAWAHVHFNRSLSDDPTHFVVTDINALLKLVESQLKSNPDLAYSRLLSPRRLDVDTAYHAFVIPTFETGRLAGLGLPLDTAENATSSSWEMSGDRPAATSFPYYARWFFRTGDLGDFEYLVKLLKPQPLDARIGTRDMDVLHPGSDLPGITNPALKGVLQLGGAMRVPREDLDAAGKTKRDASDAWFNPYPSPFQNALVRFINLTDDYATQTPAAANTAAGISAEISSYPDPVITPPLYGRWHALTQRLLVQRDGTPVPNSGNWVHQLNLDPRFRVPANFGTNVVETNSEAYMNSAWQQIGDVLVANARIRRLKLSMEVSARWYLQTVQPLATVNAERVLALTAPMNSRIVVNGKTVNYTRAASVVPPVYTSAAMRRVIRPGGRLMRMLPFTAAITPQNLLARVNAGQVSAAPPKVVPAGVPTVDQVAAAELPANVPPWLLTWLEKYPWLPLAVLIALLILALLLALLGPVGIAVAVVVAGAAVYLWNLLKNWQAQEAPSQLIKEADQTPAAVDLIPKSPNFVISYPGSGVAPTVGTADSPTAIRFKAALRDSYSLIVATRTVSPPPILAVVDLAGLVKNVVLAINPTVTIPRRGLSIISIPDWIRKLIGEEFNEVMAYPRIDLAMYTPLKDKPELLLPNINLIPDNSISLIETNQRFIESYMVGLNHEFARKLLWREYPTDQRGSYFRQFWDPRGNFNTEQLTADQLREKLYDIPELHRWPADSTLGAHNNRVPPGSGEQAILVIRGELLKKYPTAVIYAHRAQWTLKNGVIDRTQTRSLLEIDDAFEDHPPTTVIRTPLYEAKVDPDIYFFGFDLTVAEAKGGPGTNINDDPGWFFVIKQRPGEPRFGLELSLTGPRTVTDQLTWDDAGGVPAGKCLAASSLGAITLTAPSAAVEETDQFNEDKQILAAQASSARWAYLLFRAPAMVAVHAAEMLRSVS